MKMSSFRWVILVVFAVLFFAGVNHALQRWVIIPSFIKLEQKQAETELQRVIDAIQREAEHIELLAGDWALWDDTYNFVQDQNQEYVDSNLVWETLEGSSGINLIFFYDIQGRVVWGEVFDPAQGGLIQVKEFPQDMPVPIEVLFQHTSVDSSIAGIIGTSAGPVLIASKPVVTSRKEGPIAGTMLMGRFLGKALLDKLAKQTRVDFTASLIRNNSLKDSMQSHFNYLHVDHNGVNEIDENSLEISGQVSGLEGRPVLDVHAVIPREIMVQGLKVARLASISVLVSFVLLCVFLLIGCIYYTLGIRNTNAKIRKLVELRTQELKLAKEHAEESSIVAARANESKSAFLANMSHEIRTPINGAFGLIQILERSNLNNEQKETVNILRDSTVMLTSVIDDILDFSKIEAGQLNIELIPFTLHSVMESVIALLKTKARQKSLDLLLDINPHVPDVLIGDPIRLQQILLNLVNNAIKFTERGYVLVRVTNQQPQKKTVCLLFEVCDTGCGLTMKQQEKLFLPFVQADNSTTRRFGGTGLGLSICKKLVELLDGDIGVKSLPDQGSRFWCTLCFEEANLDAANLIPYEIDAQPPALRLLVVEDNPVNLRVALALLMAEDHNVLSALDGKQALDVLEKNKIDAIFMDVHMPNMDGYEATRRIRTLDNYKAKTPIIMLSADAVTKSKKEYESAGANDFISKPFELSQLNSALVKIFGLRSSSKSESIKLVPTKTKPNQEELSLIDIKALEVLQKSLGHELVDELIGDFSQQSESSIKSFETNLVKKDMLSIVEIAHCLKGSARELKAISVTQLAEEIENAQDIFEVKEKIPLLKIRLTDTLKAYGQLKSHRAIENS